MKTMREMSQEMMKLGIIDEMIEETMDNMEPADLEEAAQVRDDELDHCETKSGMCFEDDFLESFPENITSTYTAIYYGIFFSKAEWT